MLKRDFSKSNKEYFSKNKSALISLLVFLLIGILVFTIFGMNGNFEINGYNEFSITVTEKEAKDYSSSQRYVGDIVNSYNGKFDTMLVYGEGDGTKFVVRYLHDLSSSEVLEINKLVAEKLNVSVEKISEHTHVGPVVQTKDYLFTAVSILLIILVATIFAYARYNGASAMAVIISNLIGLLGFIALGTILRLQIGMSYLAMLVILSLLITYLAINLFETMHKSSWLASKDYSTALETALKTSKFRNSAVGVALMAIGLVLVLMSSSTIKFLAVNLMFMAVVLLAVILYVVPFVWSVFITRCRQREYKIKPNNIETNK